MDRYSEVERKFDADPGALLPDLSGAAAAAMIREMSAKYPYVAEIAMAASHDEQSIVGPGCDDQFEFEFALDLLLDGFERLLQQGGRPPTNQR